MEALMKDERLKEIYDLMLEDWEDEEDYYVDYSDETFEAFELLGFVYIMIEEGEVAINFYRGVNPTASAAFTKFLCDNEIEFEVYEEMYLIFNKEGECVETLFGEETDNAYFADIYQIVKKNMIGRN
jgi:hypothetical protein